MARVHICDEIMGKGKTSAFINYMNEHTEQHFIYITPYLDEVERIIANCKKRKFQRPVPRSQNGRLEDIHRMLDAGINIASTHAMFRRYTEETVQLIKANGYTLVLDEAFSVIEGLQLTADDIGILKSSDIIKIHDDYVSWVRPEFSDTRYQDVQDAATSGTLFACDDAFLFWQFPPEVFKAFDMVFVLTYLFDAQMQKYYFDTHDIAYDFVYTDMVDGEYVVVDYKSVFKNQHNLINLVHVVDDERMNEIGDKDFSLSSSWYRRRSPGDKGVKQLKSNLNNFFRNMMKARSADALWTVFERREGWLRGGGYSKGFEACNTRSTSKHRHRKYLAYCINLYMNPYVKRHFTYLGVEVDEDRYALSEMVQWIWRSAVRDGKEVWVYVPSKRMRNLLTGWLKEMAEE